jgi:hypothetical protein
MRRGGHRISRYIIPKTFGAKNPNGKKDSRSYPTYKILYIKIRVRSNFIHLRMYTQWIKLKGACEGIEGTYYIEYLACEA